MGRLYSRGAAQTAGQASDVPCSPPWFAAPGPPAPGSLPLVRLPLVRLPLVPLPLVRAGFTPVAGGDSRPSTDHLTVGIRAINS